jgi:hypothetical protein
MKLEKLLGNIDRRWHSEFLHFIETGEAGDDFLQYLNHDKGGQEAVEMAFNAQAAAFEGLAEELKKNPHIELTLEPAAAASAKMAEAVEVVLQFSPEQRNEVVQQTACALTASLPPEQRDNARSVVQTLENALARAALPDDAATM